MSTETTIQRQARQWSVALSSGDADKAMLNEFSVWRQADPRHEQAFQQVDRVWRGMEGLEHLRAHARLPEQIITTSHAERVSNQSILAGLLDWLGGFFTQPQYAAATAFTLCLVVGVVMLNPVSDNVSALQVENYQSERSQIKTLTLSDGSLVKLAPQTRIQVRFAQHQREVRLLQGEALFDVAHNPARPFVVTTGKTQTTVLGTEFNVKRRSDEVQVAVREGKVKVAPKIVEADLAEQDGSEILLPGQGVSADLAGDVGDVKTVDLASVGSWVDGRRSYEDASLAEIIEDANRYYTNGRIIIGNKELMTMRLSIAFDTQNVDKMLDTLSQAFELNINRELKGTVIIE